MLFDFDFFDFDEFFDLSFDGFPLSERFQLFAEVLGPDDLLLEGGEIYVEE